MTAPTSPTAGWRNSTDLAWLAGLAAAALFIWLRDRSWFGDAADTLPVLAALPLFYWFGSPWPRMARPFPVSLRWLSVAAGVFVVGVLADQTWLLTLGWVGALATWLRARLPAGEFRARRNLLILPVMAFPWLTLQGQAVGWWFRLSAASVTQVAFTVLGFQVSREGTHLLVQGEPVAVDASCAGLNALQAMLIAGALVAYLSLGSRPRLWWLVPLLAALAWAANTLRVMMLTAAALSFGPEFAMGWFHTFGGWLVLATMFVLTFAGFSLVPRRLALRPSSP